MDAIHRHLQEVWWLLVLRGFALILFGAVAVAWPGLTLVVLSTLFAVYLMIAGVVDTVTGIRAEGRRSLWFLTTILGLGEIGLAVFLLKTGLALATFIAASGIALITIGIFEVVAAFEYAEETSRRVLLIAGGAITLVAGFVVLKYPVSSGLAFTWAFGVWGLVWGSLQIALCLKVRAKFEELAKKSA